MVVKESHSKQILKLLRTNNKVSNFQLFKITPRYSARIHELRNDGWAIESVRDKGNMFRKARPNMFWFYIKSGREYGDTD